MFDILDPSLLLPAAGVVFIVGMTIWFSREMNKERAKHQQAVEEMEQMEEEDYTLPEPVAKTARVIDKRFSSDVIGTKSVKQVSSYFVTFFTEDGDTVEYPVPEELFLAIEKGQESTLVTIDGDFFDFGDGEDAPEEAE